MPLKPHLKIEPGVTVAALTQGSLIPSTRFRFSQYASALNENGIKIDPLTSQLGAYPPESRFLRPFWLGASLAEAGTRVWRSRSADVRFLQRNLISTLKTWEGLLPRPLLFDVDDAIFIGQRFEAAAKIASNASIIICGNTFLANYFDRFGRVVVLPTAVDTDRFRRGIVRITDDPVVLGWSGTSGGFSYLYEIEDALANVLRLRPSIVLKIISDRPPSFSRIDASQVHFSRWNADTEVDELAKLSIGLMPLTDDDWARGKCSFKMLTYMSMGIPVAASPVGMNSEIFRRGECGMGPRSSDEWVDALIHLIDSPMLRSRMGQVGREIVEREYATDLIGRKLADLILSIA